MITEMVGLAGVVIGAVLGFLASRIARALDDKQLARGYLLALQLDLLACERLMSSYKTDGVLAPAGRCPTSTWQSARVFLAGSRSMSVEDLITVGEFFKWAEQFNYCLDRASTSSGDSLAREAARAALKVEHAIGEDGSKIALGAAARQAINRAIRRMR